MSIPFKPTKKEKKWFIGIKDSLIKAEKIQKRLGYKNPNGKFTRGPFYPTYLLEIPCRTVGNIKEMWNGKRWVRIYFTEVTN